MFCSLAAVVQLLCVLRTVTALDIDTSDGGYTNLLVTIDESVSYDGSIIGNIQALFRSSSAFLHRATSGRVYFKHVIIDIPDTWTEDMKARSVSRTAFGRGDVRVRNCSRVCENRPFTKQVKLCGHRGEFIQLSSQFLDEWSPPTMAKSESSAHVFVHEWAHYRYGVFDEYGSRDDDEHPLTYCHGDKVKLNSCSERIQFMVNTSMSQTCGMRKNCQFTKDCLIEFFSPMNYTVESSIMFMPYVSNISYFCDDIKRNRLHNSFAPNKQNKFCDGMSTWQVIMHNEDFRKLPLPDMAKSVETTFEVVSRDDNLKPVVVLVLDVSGSMFKHHRLDYLKETAKGYIRRVPDNSIQLAIVVFESTARIASCLKPVNETTRGDFIDVIQRLTCLDGTCVSCGLYDALTIMIQERNFSFPTDVNFLVDHTVGKSTTVHIRHMDRDKTAVDAWLSDPNGVACDACSVDRTWLSTTITIPNEPKLPQAGNWTLHMKSPDTSAVSLYVEVKSRARSTVLVPVTLVSEVSSPLVHVPNLAIYAHLKKGVKVVLHADVDAEVLGPIPPYLSTTPLHDDGNYPDITANDGTYSGYFTAYAGRGKYTVVVRAKNNNRTTTADDPFPGSGGIPGSVNIHSNSETRKRPSSEYLIDEFDIVDSNNDGGCTARPHEAGNWETFERAATGGSFHVATDIYEKDIPPTRIRDLRVTDMEALKNGKLLVNITWTWPGAHLMTGKASSVEIRIGHAYDQLTLMFDEQTLVNDTDVVVGNLKPLPLGSKHIVSISLPVAFSTPRADGTLAYSALLAARVVNRDGLKSNISNVVSVYHVPTLRKAPSAAPVKYQNYDWIWIVIALLIACVLIAIVVVVVRKTKLHKRDVYAIFARKQRHAEPDPV
nr:calcium-activated chloride channel regulator 2-like isoform X2 [Rhipicephalus microplus]